MQTNEELLKSLMDKVSDRVTSDLKETLAKTVQEEIMKNLSRALMEGEFYRRINTDLQSGLKEIYQEVNSVKQNDDGTPAPQDAGELFMEASDQLDEILKTTERATEQIMELVEKHMDKQARSAELLVAVKAGETDKADELVSINNELGVDLMQIMTTLSFQDLTGQRIKRIITALQKVEAITFDLFVSTGLKIKAKETDPDKDYHAIESETKQRVSTLKGPQTDVSQGDVDDLLSQLGLE